MAAWCWGQRAAQHFSATPEADRARARRLAQEAEALSPDDPMVLTFVQRRRSLAAPSRGGGSPDRTGARARSRRAWLSAYQGDSDSALRAFRRLMPFDALRHTAFIGIGCAHFAAGRYERAALWARSGVEAVPTAFWGERIVIAGAVHAGARAEARRYARRLLRKDPDLTITVAGAAWPFRPDFMARLFDGLAVAGIPRA